MKNFYILALTVALIGFAGMAVAKDDVEIKTIETPSQKVEFAVEDTADAIKTNSKKAGKVIKDKSVEVGNKAKENVKSSSKKAGKFIKDKSKEAGEKTKEGAKKGAKKVKDATVKAGNKVQNATAKGMKKAGKKIQESAEKTIEKTDKVLQEDSTVQE